MRRRYGFTIAELVTAIAILVMVVGFTSAIFRKGIESYRTANANIEIMQKLRAITEQLNSDFEGFCKDGYLIIRSSANMDRIYYFTTGDFQSWFDAGVKSNIARVFWGHDRSTLNDDSTPPSIPPSRRRMVRDVLLLIPDPELDPAIVLPDDCNNISFAQCKADLSSLENSDIILNNSVSLSEPNNFGSFVCEGVGEFNIQLLNRIDSDGELDWDPSGITAGPNDDKPRAIKFTFTLYDSRGILEGGRRFSHIVYLGD